MTRIQPKGGFTKSPCGANDGSRQDQTWKGSTWDTFPIKQNQQGGFQRNSIFYNFDHFRVWEIQLRTLGRRKGDFSGERPNIDRSSNVWSGLIMPKGQVCRTHATPDLIPLPRSTFLRVLANYAKIPIYMPCFFFEKNQSCSVLFLSSFKLILMTVGF